LTINIDTPAVAIRALLLQGLMLCGRNALRFH
jgi:hypothetical protein